MLFPTGKLRKNQFIRNSLNYIWGNRGLSIVSEIKPFINKTDNILDIGSGMCDITRALRLKGYKVTPVDIQDLSVFDDIVPVVYNGKKLPFKDNEFNTALLLDMLHHVPDPISLLKEAKRVAKRLVIMEGTYQNQSQKYLTFLMDSVTNLEFIGHPHNNKSGKEWVQIFESLNLKVKIAKSHDFWKYFEATTYILERKSK